MAIATVAFMALREVWGLDLSDEALAELAPVTGDLITPLLAGATLVYFVLKGERLEDALRRVRRLVGDDESRGGGRPG